MFTCSTTINFGGEQTGEKEKGGELCVKLEYNFGKFVTSNLGCRGGEIIVYSLSLSSLPFPLMSYLWSTALGSAPEGGRGGEGRGGERRGDRI